MNNGIRFARVIVMAVALVIGLGQAPAAADEWAFDLTPYMWLSDVTMDVEVNGVGVGEGTIDAADVIDALDFAMMANFQARKGSWGLLFDLGYFDSDDNPKRHPLDHPAGAELVLKGDMEITMLDAGGIFNPSGDGYGFTLIYGVRIIDTDQEIDAHVEAGDAVGETERYGMSNTLLDGLIGFRYMAPFADSWLFHLKGDFSTGETENTWSALMGLGYTFGSADQYSLLAGYRTLQIELLEKDAMANVEVTNGMSGPYFALRIGF